MRLSRKDAKQLGLDAPKGRHKYGAKATTVDGITFASAKEARRYSELRLLEQAGEISHLELQPEYPLVVADVVIGKWLGDFRYRDKRTGKQVVEDVKGMRTPIYRLKKKMVEAFYGIRILET